MKVTYIAHSGFAVETGQQVLLFDYAEGELPTLPADKPWYVFASHVHNDHFSPAIFSLAKKQERVSFLLSSDISGREAGEGENRVIFIKPWETIMVDGMRVETLKSTDEGVAFLLTLSDGRTVYHAGDLNDWFWEGESPEWNRKMEQSYDAILEKIRGRHLDVAFVPVDPRLGAHAWDGAEHLLRRVTADLVVPMHCWEDYSVIPELKRRLDEAGICARVADITGRGQVFFCD